MDMLSCAFNKVVYNFGQEFPSEEEGFLNIIPSLGFTASVLLRVVLELRSKIVKALIVHSQSNFGKLSLLFQRMVVV